MLFGHAFLLRPAEWPGGGHRFTRAGMQRPVGQVLSQRDIAYQPRARLWVSKERDSRVLKERCISLDGEYLHDQPRFGVPSEREGFIVSVPGVAPRAGMRCPFGARVARDPTLALGGLGWLH